MKTRLSLAVLLLGGALSVHAEVDKSKGYADQDNFNLYGSCSYINAGVNYTDDSNYNYLRHFKDKTSQFDHLNYKPEFNNRALRGNWYSLDNQLFRVGNQNVPKYSGETATGSAKAAPMAVQQGDWTYVVLNGAHSSCAVQGTPPNKGYERLVIAVSAYNHKTGEVKEPAVIHVKNTSDFHDTAVINMDKNGHLYVFISGRNSSRGGLIYRSKSSHLNGAGDLRGFKLVNAENELSSDLDSNSNCSDTEACNFLGFSYPQAWWTGNKFVLLNTRYIKAPSEMSSKYKQTARRQIYMTEITPSGSSVSVAKSKKLVALNDATSFGHYAVSAERNGVIAMAFNVHVPDKCTLKSGYSSSCKIAAGSSAALLNRHFPNDNRTNIYFIYSKDGGRTWSTSSNQKLIDTAYGQYISDFNTLNKALLYKSDSAVEIVNGYTPKQNLIQKRAYIKDIDFSMGPDGKLAALKVLFVESDGKHGFAPKSASDSKSLIRAKVVDEQGGVTYVGCYNGSNCATDHAYSAGAVRTINRYGYSEIAFPMQTQADSLAGGKVHLYTSNLKYKTDVYVWSYNGAQHYTDPKNVNFIRKVHNAAWGWGGEPVYFWSQSGNDNKVDFVLSGKNGRQVTLNGNFGDHKTMSCPTQYVFNKCQ
ncbi:hypothetical protein PSECIP111854_03064 [Pseudoalteromonas sp. CIP111854]|uniref:Exo-alpha-sialidase n=1 Tax=Pseudoalteromonas holothuriae TaxID=2963714 RepID=A0A9W4R1V3_9GAMM|nr:BNR-4 repeat-containing protein [Pseudoalteromonas sp. CIP111854]CAH9062683.1 hypothetical protein PSECIP111854_03064 [Pseudoalteromonas sp. CIP111854]